ncbi:hypothetical protein [Paenibacillus segetis]|uniref:Uncharacterized protein n=1 Tax=Paenibacillus segetis TaxID=1325360 RepID=A0ABQ1Y8G9_9BACL|nr:hypothetical protein [Paenibacillus segetis]GGH16672.1 hypothetical protein GCM10008013_11580 [Paenibacillus segetis]
MFEGVKLFAAVIEHPENIKMFAFVYITSVIIFKDIKAVTKVITTIAMSYSIVYTVANLLFG